MSESTITIPIVLRVDQLTRAATEAITGESAGFRRHGSPLDMIVKEVVDEARVAIKAAVAEGLKMAIPSITDATAAAFIKGAEVEAEKHAKRTIKAAAQAASKKAAP